MQPIALASVLPADLDPSTCKLHCAVFNGQNHPIDILANDPAEWQRWNSWRGDKNDFNRQFIFALAQDRHDPSLWLFGGTWEVTGRRPEPRTFSYDVILREDLMGPFVRRLYIRLHLAGRQRRRTMESCLDEMSVSSILEEAFAGDPFPGHDRINHTLAYLQVIVGQQRADWRIALEHMKGVYVTGNRRSVRGGGLWRYRHLAALERLRSDSAREQRRPEGSCRREGRGLPAPQHEVRVAGVLVDAYRGRARLGERVVLEGSSRRALTRLQQELASVAPGACLLRFWA